MAESIRVLNGDEIESFRSVNDNLGNPLNGRDKNWLIYNEGHNVGPNFNFMLRVEGVFDLPCRKVHNFTKANEYEYIQEGGLNDYVHMRRKPISQPFSFQVERYVGVDYLDPLQPGTDLILPVVLMVWRLQMNGNFTPFRVYTFTGCTVMSKDYGELNAEQSGLLTETTTIGYRELVRLTTPDGIADGSWLSFQFAEDSDSEQYLMDSNGAYVVDEQGNKIRMNSRSFAGNNQHARTPVMDSIHATPQLWDGISKDSSGKLKVSPSLRGRTPAKDSTHATQVAWDGFDKQTQKAAPPLRGKVADNTKDRAQQVIWPGEDKDAVRANTLRDATGKKIEGKKGDLRYSTAWDGFDKETQTAAPPHRGQVADNTKDRAQQVIWPGGDKEAVRANTLRDAAGNPIPGEGGDNRFEAKWEGIESGGKASPNARGQLPANNAERSKQVMWNGGKNVRANTMRDAAGNPVPGAAGDGRFEAKWEGIEKDGKASPNARGQVPANNADRAEQVSWGGFEAEGGAAPNIRGRVPAKDKERATQVLWPKDSRARMADVLKGGGV